ncbi:MAG: GNAT family N-acetyltransferase [Myxococcales bacterium]|nr:GNAT family N-acetyltransferase [Myxococcales bacterium]
MTVPNDAPVTTDAAPEQPAPKTLASGDGWSMHMASERDGADLCALFRDVHLPGDLDIVQERDPDFFALLRLHHGAFDTCVGRDSDGRLVGCGSVVSRPGWLRGESVQTGYLCDLRVAPGFRGGLHLAHAYKHFMSAVSEQHGAELFTTVIFDSNKPAIRALTGGGSGLRAGQPLYRPMTPFSMVSVQHTLRKPAPSAQVSQLSDIAGSGGTGAVRDELLAWLCERQQGRMLGHCLNPDELASRMDSWPNFDIERFLIYRDRVTGRITGALAPWNTQAVKRTRVLGYHRSMAWVKRAFNTGAFIGRFPPLPQPGSCFDFSFLTHLEVQDDDPAVLRELLLAAYAQMRARGEHFMSACVPRGSPMAAAFKGFTVQETAMTLYTVHPVDSRFTAMDLRSQHPGFEMALS